LRLYATVLCFLVFAIACYGQADANRGQIVGTVYDPNQAVVPDATIRLKNVQEGTVRELRTDAEGLYRAVQLVAGRYEVTVEKEGFAASIFTDVVVNVGASVELNAVLQIGNTAQTVEVGETLLQVNLPMPTTNVDTVAITNLPILGRRFQDFATLTPTVQIEPARQQLSFVGQRGVNANVMLDGTDYNQPFFGGIRGGERSNFAFTLPQSAIQEFQTVTSGYSAEYGRSTGGVLNAITKSGSNNYHGEAFYQLRHKEMGLENPILNVAPNETLQQFGGAIGGPLVRDKWFWFAAAEQQFSRVPRQVLFTTLNGVTPTDATQEAYNFFRSQEESFKQTNDATALTARTDYQFMSGHRLALRYNYSRNNAENGVTTGGALNPISSSALTNEGTEKNGTHTGTAQYTHLLSPTTINDTRFSWTYEKRPRESNSDLPLVIAGTGSLIGRFGSTDFLPTFQDDRRIQIVNSLTTMRGAHTLKLGGDYSRLNTFQEFGRNVTGQFVLNGTNVNTLLDVLGTGGTVANRFDTRDVTYQRQIGDRLAEFGAHQLAFFAQDSWRVTQSLTLDLGLRWEGQFNPSPDTNNRDLADRVKNASFPNGQVLDPDTIPDALDQIMPRFGFAWSPFSTTKRRVVRGHAGIFYGATPMLLFAGHTNNFRTPPGNISITLAPTATQTVYQQLLAAGADLNQYPLDALPVIPVETVQRAAALAAGGTARDPLTGAGIDIVAPDFRNPRSYQAGLGVETEVLSNLVAGVQLNYVKTVNLHRNRDYNLPGPMLRTGDLAQRVHFGQRSGVPRPIPTLGQFTVRESSAESMFRGATFQAQYRARRFQFGAFYTLSENFSDSDLERDAGGVDFQNAYDFQPDYNYSRLDARHQFTANGLVSLPLDFEVSGIFRARTGYPLNATTGGDQNEDLFNTDRPFAAPGNPMERNAFRNRSFNGTDLRILKNFRFGEVTRLQFSAELFNLFNVDNVEFIESRAGIYGLGINPTTGEVAPIDTRFQRLYTSAGDYDPATTQQRGTPLQVQFGLRFFF
jgi:hypothetical protein